MGFGGHEFAVSCGLLERFAALEKNLGGAGAFRGAAARALCASRRRAVRRWRHEVVDAALSQKQA